MLFLTNLDKMAKKETFYAHADASVWLTLAKFSEGLVPRARGRFGEKKTLKVIGWTCFHAHADASRILQSIAKNELSTYAYS